MIWFDGFIYTVNDQKTVHSPDLNKLTGKIMMEEGVHYGEALIQASQKMIKEAKEKSIQDDIDIERQYVEPEALNVASPKKNRRSKEDVVFDLSNGITLQIKRHEFVDRIIYFFLFSPTQLFHSNDLKGYMDSVKTEVQEIKK